MVINVYIPTYKRLNSLSAVLYSLIKVNLPLIKADYNCYVVNNFPDNKDAVDKLIKEFNLEGSGWVIKSVHREKTLPPVISWYKAINEFTGEGDIAFLHGDDDLFLPDSIEFRVNTILEENADLLLTKHMDGVIFYDNSSKISVENDLERATDNAIKCVEWSDYKWNAIFIGNNTYRMTPMLKEAFKKSMEWCETQDWLTFDQRTLMYPVYIPYSLILLGGKIVSSEKVCVLRGRNIDESKRSLWFVPGWNSGFLDLVAIGVLNNVDLKNISELYRDRKAANDHAALWYWTFFFDSRITKEVRKRTFHEIGKPKFSSKILFKSLIFLIRGLIYKYKFTNKLRDRFRKKIMKIEVQLFIDALYKK